MAVEKVGEKYRCNVCGNEVVVTKVGGGSLVCCGQDMERIELKTPEVINLPDAEG
jgi:desulfoferrodoxin-like iron-binding protein